MTPKCVWTRQHWQDLVVKAGLVDEQQTIGVEEFGVVLRCCLYRFHLGQLNMTLLDKHSSRELVSCARALKFLLIRQGPLRAYQLRDASALLKEPSALQASSASGSASLLYPVASVRQLGAQDAAGAGAEKRESVEQGRAVDEEVARQMKSMNDTLHMLLGKVNMMERELSHVRAAVCSNNVSPRAGPPSESVQRNELLPSSRIDRTPEQTAGAFSGGAAAGSCDAGAEQTRANANAGVVAVSLTSASMGADDMPRRVEEMAGKEMAGEDAGDDALGEGWRRYWSRSRSRYYYRNKITGQSSWVRPSNEMGFQPSEAARSASYDEGYGDDGYGNGHAYGRGANARVDPVSEDFHVKRERDKVSVSYSKRRADAEDDMSDERRTPSAGRRSVRGGHKAMTPTNSRREVEANRGGFAREETAMPETQVAKLELGALGASKSKDGVAPSLKLSPRGPPQHGISSSVHSFERPSPRVYGGKASEGPGLLQGVAGYAGGLSKSLSDMMGGGISQASNAGSSETTWSRRKMPSELDTDDRSRGGLLSAADLRAVAAAGARATGARLSGRGADEMRPQSPQSPPGNSRLRVF